jgi:(1->4)-alpha-D-glucan 1-alpha-D-glucosylmutase
MSKAVREAQVHSGWINPNETYEAALSSFVRAALDASHANPFLDDLAPLRDLVAHAGAINALAQQLLKLTAPGMPDIYQGTEVWDQSLVDPDNRRPVDYGLRTRLLDELAEAEPSSALTRDLLDHKADSRVKLHLTSRALAFRATHSELFARGDYVPLYAEGSATDHIVAFARRFEDQEVIVAVPRLVAGLTGKALVDPIGPEVWGDTRLLVPDVEAETRYRDVFSGEEINADVGDEGVSLPLADVLSVLPFALVKRIA